jgi:hypothetical protein
VRSNLANVAIVAALIAPFAILYVIADHLATNASRFSPLGLAVSAGGKYFLTAAGKAPIVWREVWMLRLATTIVLALIAIGCGGGPSLAPSPTTADNPATHVSLTMTARQEQKHLLIEGRTDLPDGARIAWEVSPSDPSVPNHSDGLADVSGGRWSASVDVADWQSGNVEVWAAFQTILGTKETQMPDIITKFGPMGEKLTGPNVTQAGDIRRVETTITVELRGLG